MALIDPNEMMYTAFEPQVQNRFLMYIDGIPSYMVKKASAPGITFTEVKLDHINTYRKLKGKANWEDLSIQMYAPITPSGAQAVMEWIRLAHESVTGRNGYSDFYKKDITFNVLGPVGDVVSEWILKGCFVKSAKFGEFDWSQDQYVTIDATFTYDFALLNF
jgi:hypothetical protein